MDVPLALAGGYALGEARERVAGEAPDPAEAGDLLRAFDHAEAQEGHPGVGELDAGQAVPQRQEVGDRHPQPRLRPDLGAYPARPPDQLADGVGKQAHALVGRARGRPPAHVIDPAARGEALHVGPGTTATGSPAAGTSTNRGRVGLTQIWLWNWVT